MENNYQTHWKLKRYIRENKTCNTCHYRTSLIGQDDILLCLYDFEHNGEEHPLLVPSIKTCFKYKKSEHPSTPCMGDEGCYRYVTA